LDDRTCFEDVLKKQRRPVTKKKIQELISRKADYYQETIKKELKLFPGVKSFVQQNKKHFSLAIVSGALRHEINWILKRTKLKEAFSVIVSAENVKRSKPYPDCYQEALKLLNHLLQFKNNPLKPAECLAVEDSIHGVESAHKAGMKCLAVTNSYSKKELSKAEIVVNSLVGINLSNFWR